MKKLLVSLVVAVVALASGVAAQADPLLTSSQIVVNSKSVANTAVTDAVAEVKWPSEAGKTYAVAAVATGKTTKFGANPTCVNNSCTSLIATLEGGVSYSIYVSAVDASGTKFTSEAKSFTAQSIPSVPSPQAATVSGSEATLTWTAPTSDGGLSLGNYTITGGPTAITVAGNLTTTIVKNLVYGTPYSFKISASNSLGSTASVDFPKSVTAISAPEAPAAPTAVADGTTIKVNWKAPSDNGAVINGYKVYLVAADGADVGAVTSVIAGALTVNLENVETGTYTVQVIASNSVGDSPRSTSSGPVPISAGTAPAIGSATIIGTARVGEILTAVAGSVAGSPTPKGTYQWKRAGAAITGETSSTYTVVSADVGKTLSVTITETNGVGTPASKTSSATSAVIPVDSAATIDSVIITGIAKVGKVLSASPVNVAGYPTATTTYQWLLDGQNIQSATGSSYTVALADLGHVITVTATATNAGGHQTVTSTPTSAVLPADVAPAVASVSIAGTARVGQTLTATSSGVTGSPEPTKSYLWKRGTTTIAGATGATYTLVTADLNKAITVKVTVTNVAGSANRTSAPTVSVIAQFTAATSVSASITGTPTVGQTLSAVATSEGAAPTPTYAYVWKRNGSPISGTSSSTYVLVADDIAATISVTVTATNGSGSTVGSSGNTQAVTAAPAVSVPEASSPVSVDTKDATETVTTTPVVLDSSNPAVREVSATGSSLFSVSISLGGGSPSLNDVRISVPAGAVSAGSKLSVSPAVTTAELSAGLLTLSVQITDATGGAVTKLAKPISLTLGKLSLEGLSLAYSSDGLVWVQIQKLSGTTLPSGVAEGYYVDGASNLVIVTSHLTYFGLKKSQDKIVARSSKLSELAGRIIGLVTSGGSGSGYVSAKTLSPDVCSVAYGKISLLAPGTCKVTALKNGDGTYLDATSAAVTVTSLAAIASLAGKNGTKRLAIQASLSFAGKQLVVQVQKNSKGPWARLLTAKFNNVANYSTRLKITGKGRLRVLSSSRQLLVIQYK
jgi:hypothetical protein